MPPGRLFRYCAFRSGGGEVIVVNLGGRRQQCTGNSHEMDGPHLPSGFPSTTGSVDGSIVSWCAAQSASRDAMGRAAGPDEPRSTDRNDRTDPSNPTSAAGFTHSQEIFHQSQPNNARRPVTPQPSTDTPLNTWPN
ncbi:hypothetical protein PGT21_036844 [Puccinia graminis f. sp. tritici]|uniref:Uncharacterized protein n=1 Tax=Puccinia graminis f. sp. tritici TaxID=56615 RepID=A0A5B0QQQ5_PUCGR|nr:hypothetical protein PGT21_036844 [Puccinia graminis f. sp. tritici]